jgi:uncharacterized protein YcfL
MKKISYLVLLTLVLVACSKPSKEKVVVKPIIITSKDTTILNVEFKGDTNITSFNNDSVYIVKMKQVK